MSLRIKSDKYHEGGREGAVGTENVLSAGSRAANTKQEKAFYSRKSIYLNVFQDNLSNEKDEMAIKIRDSRQRA